MNERIQTTLQEIFGFSQPRPGLLEVIEHLLAGHSAAAIFSTGGGKALCCQLPALLLPGVTLVVSPLIVLMKDQIDALRKKGVNASRLDSSLDLEEYREVTAQLRSGELQQARPKALTSPRLLARFLCGITSPRLSHGKHTRHTLFGSLKKVPFGEVLLKAEQDYNAFRYSPISLAARQVP